MTGNAPSSEADSFAGYAAEHSDARFTAWLRNRAEPSWSDAVDHRFTREVRAGTIDDDAFRRYLIQDYAFVRTLVGTFGHAVGEAPTMAAASRLVEFLSTLTADENDYFERAFDALGVPEAARKSSELEPEHEPGPEPVSELAEPTRAFCDLLERAARQGGYAETLAVLVPAEWIYREWATTAPAPTEPFYLTEWVELHATEEFEAFVDWLRAELDRVGAAAAPRRQKRLDRLFQRTVSLEVAFFDAAYADAMGEDDRSESGSRSRNSSMSRGDT